MAKSREFLLIILEIDNNLITVISLLGIRQKQYVLWKGVVIGNLLLMVLNGGKLKSCLL